MSESDAVRQGLREIDFVLHSSWRLGKTIVAGWAYQGSRISFCFSEPYNVLGRAADLPRLIRGKRMMGPRTFAETCKALRARAVQMDLPFSIGSAKGEINPLLIENLVKRYAVMETASRAVVLFDIVGFSKHTPLEQVAQLSSLEYSINSAVKRMNTAGLRTELARSTVGDGFYVWNRAKGIEADLRCWLALLLILADNALARQKGDARLVPTLRAAFSIGSHFSYHQVEGTQPRGFEYIVGDVTITLARIIAKALPGQVLAGSFSRELPANARESALDTPAFLARASAMAEKLNDIEVGRLPLLAMRAAPTGPSGPRQNGSLLYRIGDKHGYLHHAFNIRAAIERDGSDSLLLGLTADQLGGFAAEAMPYEAKATARTKA
ncbi:hypothetical protein [Ferrovibrio sp.]|jgi:hypothetical protein|uniref:hypothetical protein n=1 Tax=Ferrovibrio sp. TaxID=1917215 RepID=UPI0035B30F8C